IHLGSVQPTPSGFIINAAGPGSFGRVNFYLLATHTAALIFCIRETPDLDTRIHFTDFHFQFQNKVTINLVGSQERIGLAGNRGSNYGSILYLLYGLAP